MSSMHNSPSSVTPAFKRTTQACQHCQGSKRRCDRRIVGSDCTNCRLDGVLCVPGKSKPQRQGKRRSTKASLSGSRAIPASTIPSPLPRLPDFVKPLPPNLNPEELEYLERKGVFDIPAVDCRNEILRNYFLFVYPLLPLLDVETFLVPILENDGADKISLMLFYAVMGGGAGHVDMRVLRELGFNSRKAARRAFFERARLLYDFDCEPDKISLVQAFVLMTYWYDAKETYRNRTFWIRLSVTIAQDIGLDLDLEFCNTKRQRLLKRVWWCCFMRDQFVALMIWAPPQLGSRHRHLTPLELEDFEVQEFSSIALNSLDGWDSITDRESRLHLAALCIAKARLCVCINQILQMRYCNFRYESGDQMTTILVPRHAPANAFEILELDRELREWYYDLSSTGSFDFRRPAESVSEKISGLVAMHRAHLKLLFLSALIALHRPQAMNTTSSLPATYHQLSRTQLHDAADEIAHVAISIRNLRMGTHMSPRGLNLLLPIMLAHLQDVTPVVDLHPRSRLDKYHDCMQTLDDLGEVGGSEFLLPSKLEVAFLKFNILPSQEWTIPRSIDFGRFAQDSSLIAPVGDFPFLTTQLGAINPSEVDMLKEMSVDHGHVSSTTDCDEDVHQNPQNNRQETTDTDTTSETVELQSPALSRLGTSLSVTLPPSHAPSQARYYTCADEPALGAEDHGWTVDWNDDDTLIEKFFEWRLQKTKLPVQRKIVEQAHQTVLLQMWTLDDLRAMEDAKSEIYRLAVHEGIPDGLARSFRRELALFASK